ncbi:MAG: hypothetical protein KGN38_08990 [Actinomycetales bacterium]|nr:hypothetical protein [Actinomycetales bacterium]
MDPRALGEQIIAARSSGRLLDAPADHGLDAVSAYAVQDMITDWRVSSGAHIAGWKLGYTSEAMREQMGIDEPNFGPLFDTMLLSSGAVISEGVVHPRVEPEIAAVLARDVALPTDAVDAVGEWRLALEIVDSVWHDYRFGWALNTADGSSAAFVVLGDPVVGVADLDIELDVGGQTLVGRSNAAMGDPRIALRWLAEQLKGHPRGLRAGDVVITGGLTRAMPLEGMARARAGAAEVCVTR